jgi:hypothetical protein
MATTNRLDLPACLKIAAATEAIPDIFAFPVLFDAAHDDADVLAYCSTSRSRPSTHIAMIASTPNPDREPQGFGSSPRPL